MLKNHTENHTENYAANTKLPMVSPLHKGYMTPVLNMMLVASVLSPTSKVAAAMPSWRWG